MGNNQVHMECQKKKSVKCVLSLCDKILVNSRRWGQQKHQIQETDL